MQAEQLLVDMKENQSDSDKFYFPLQTDFSEEIELLIKALAKAVKRKASKSNGNYKDTILKKNGINDASMKQVIHKLKQLESNEIPHFDSLMNSLELQRDERMYQPKVLKGSQNVISQKDYNSAPSTPKSFQNFIMKNNRNSSSSSLNSIQITKSQNSVPDFMRKKPNFHAPSFSLPLPV